MNYKTMIRDVEYREKIEEIQEIEARIKAYRFMMNYATNQKEFLNAQNKLRKVEYERFAAHRELREIKSRLSLEYNLDALSYSAVYPVDDEYYIVKIRNGETVKGYSV